jgi:hypothetical protein
LLGLLFLYNVLVLRTGFSVNKLKYQYAAPIILYVIYFISFILSHNKLNGLLELKVKAGLVLLPVFFLFIPVNKKLFIKLIWALLAGFILTSSYHIVKACMHINALGICAFYYTAFTEFQHPSYLSMYTNWCLLLSIFLATYQNNFNRYKFLFLAFWFFAVAVIMFCGSKAGVIACALISLYIIVVQLFRRQYAMAVLYLLMTALSAAIFQNAINATCGSRMQNFNAVLSDSLHNNIESTNARKIVLQSTLKMARTHWLTGYGCGDMQDSLDATYVAGGYSSIKEEHLNAHDQYMQVLLSVGIIGLIILLFWMAGFMFLKPMPGLQFLGIGFAILVGFSLLFESMFERQAGVMFILFWHCLLFKMAYKEV